MSDKITLDFENNLIIWDTDTQKGVECCPDLATRKNNILEAMGYSAINMAPAVKIVEALFNGQISRKEADLLLDEFEKN